MSEHYYTAAQVRELDHIAIEKLGIPAFELMYRAGTAAFTALQEEWPAVQKLLVFCGSGNNGGDGFVIAGLAREAGCEVLACLIGEAASLQGAAREAYEFAIQRKVPLLIISESKPLPPLTASAHCTVVVDALLGTGLRGPVRPLYRRIIDAINASGLPVLAVDIPSGLCSDTGKVQGACIKADLTVTFIGRKIGLVVGDGPVLCGKLVFDDLGTGSAVNSP